MHHVDAADLVELLLGQRVMQMAEMGDAQIGDLEDEDRIAVPLGAAAHKSRMLVGTLRTRTSPDLHVMARRLVRARAPAAQHVLDAGIGVVGVVGRMRVVHGDDVGQHRAACT